MAKLILNPASASRHEIPLRHQALSIGREKIRVDKKRLKPWLVEPTSDEQNYYTIGPPEDDPDRGSLVRLSARWPWSRSTWRTLFRMFRVDHLYG